MSRHRQVRGMDFGEDYEGYYDVYGHSVEDDYCVSPSTAAQFLYPRGDKSQQLAAFMAEEGGIKEEDEEEEDIKEPEEKSLSQVRSQLSETDQAKLLSCLEEMHNILGDSQPEHVLINAIISHQFNLDQALNTLLQSSSTSNVATALPQRQDRRQERDLNSDIISSEIVSVNEMATKPISAGAELHCQKSPCTRTISVDKTPSAHEGSKAGSDWLNPQTDEQQSVVLGKSCGCGGGAPKTLLFSYLSNGEEEAGSAPPLTRSVRIPPGFEKSCMRTKERLLAEPKSTGLLVASPSTTRVVADSESLASLTTLLDKQPVSLFELAVGADNGNRTEAPSLAAMAAAHGLAESDQASVCSLANLKETEMPFHSGSSAPQSIVASTQRRTRVQASRIAEHGEAMRQERLPASLAVLAALDKGAPSGARIVSLADLARHDLHLTGSSVLSDVAAAGAQRAEESVAALPQTSHAQSKCVADAAACHRDPSVTSHRPHTSVSTLPFTQHSTETTTTFVNIPRTVTTNSPLTQFLLSSLASSPDCKTTNPPPSQFSLSSLASSPDCTPANPLPSQFSLSSLASSPDCKATNPPPSQFSLSSLASSPDFKTTNPPPSQFSLSSLASSPDCKTTNHPPSQFSLSSLASSPDCKPANPLPSQFSLSSLVSSPDCKTTNPLPSQFSLSSLVSSPDCKTTNHPPSQFSLSSLASSPDCKTTNHPPSQFSLSSLASSPDCKTTNHPPSQFSLSSLASSPDCKTTNHPPSPFSLSSLASSPDCKTTNHPPSQFSLSSLASSPDCKTTNSPSSQFSLLSLVSSIDCKTTNPPPSQFSLSSLASSPDCKPTNPPCAQFSLSSHPSVPHGVVLLPGHDATSLPQCGWASDNKSPASIDREDLRTSAPRPSAHQEVNFDLSLTDGFPFRQPQSSTSGANVSALSKKPSGFAHALCCRPSAPYRVNIFEPSDFLLRRDGLTSSEVRSQPNLYWVLRALYQAGTKEGADVLSLRSNSYGQESEKADLEANPSDSHPGMDAVPSGSHSGKDAEPSDGHPGRDAVPSRSHSGNDAGPSDSGSEVVESEADLDTASCDSSLDSAVTTYVNTTAPLGDSDTPESVAGREACSDIKASVTDSDSEQKQTRIVVPFDFGTPSPDDIVLSRQREAFREGYGQRSQRKMPVVQKAPSDRLLPKPVVVVPPGDATARITNSVAMINFSGQRTEGFEMPKKETRSGSGSGSGSRPMSRERTPDRTPEKSPEKTLEVPPRKTRTLEQATDASSPAPASTPSLPKSASKAKGLDKLDMEMEYEKRKATKKQMLNLVVIGHVDAGKSTLMGHVLYKLGQVNQRTMHKYEQESRKQGKSSFAFAWVLDETPEERQRGVTMDVAQTQFETDTKSVTLLDAPGHKDFIPNMITGAASADVAVLVVCATRGEFETGFESGGQTREHALLVRSLGVSQLGVAVNKMDTVGWSQERFDEITRKLMQFLKQAGFKEKDVSFVPCSGLSGENLVAAATDPLLCSWYGGPSMLQVIDRFAAPQRPVDKPFRLVVSDVYKGMGSGFCVSGRIEAGSVQTGEKVLVMPTGDMALVKAIQLQDDLVTCAFAGDHVIVTLFNIEMTSAAIGHVLCYAAQPIRVASVIQARIVVFNIDMPITRGFPVVFHYQMLNETAVIRKLISQLHKSNGEVIKKRPRCLTKQSNALIELAIERPICMELYKDNRDLGRFMLRYAGHTIAAGLVTEIIS